MKPKAVTPIIFLFFIISLVVGIIMVSYSSYSFNNISTQKIHGHLEDIIEIRTDHVMTFLDGKKERLTDFSSDLFIKEKLKELKGPSGEVSKKLSDYLRNNKIVLDESFYKIFVLNNEGKLVGTTNENEFGGDFSESSIFTKGKDTVYIREYFYDEEFKRDGITLSAPIFDDGDFLGVIGIKMNLDQLGDIVVSAGKFSQYEELYVLDSSSFMITPSKFLRGADKGVLVQEVDTVNAEGCLKFISGDDSEDSRINYFLNYRGEYVVGIYNPLPSTNWCLLVEIEVWGGLKTPQKEFIKNQIFTLIIIVMVMTLIGYFSGRFLEKKYSIKKRGRK